MSYKLTTAQPADVDSLTEMYRLCYPLIDLSPEERYNYFVRNPRCDLEDVFVVKDGKEPIASMIAYRFDQFQEEVEIPVIGIANVMVAPNHRRRGVANFMMQRSLEIFEEEGIAAAILYPFEHRFYRYFGWGYAGEIRQYQIRCRQLAEYLEEEEDDDLETVLFQEQQMPQLMEFYDAVASRSNGMLKRNEEYWRGKLVEPPRQAVLAYFNGEIIGYLIYSLEKIHSDNLFVQEIVVHEWMAPTLDARDALLGFLAKQSDQVESIRLSLQPDEPFHLWVDDPRNKNHRFLNRLYAHTATVGLGWMYRLVSLKEAFESGRRFNNVKGDLRVEVEDDQLGDREIGVTFSGNGAKVDKATSKPERIVRGTVDIVSQLFCGYTTAEEAYEQDLLEFEGKDTIEFCQQAFWLPAPRCYDLF